MTAADHRHDTDYTDRDGGERHPDQDPTEFDASRVSGSYADGRTETTDGTHDSGHDGTYERTADEHTGTHQYDAGSTDTLDASDRLDSDRDGYDRTDETATERHEGGYASRHDEDTTSRDGSLDTTGTHSVDAGQTAGTATGDGTPAVATDTTSTSSTTSSAGGGNNLERLVPATRVDEYTSRWDAVKGEFVDEPRQAVAKADKLVGELLDELDQLFRKQRSDLEHGLDADETSTEDLRLALRKYRSFFDRLLAL